VKLIFAEMATDTENMHIDRAFERIVGTPPPLGFGEPFATAFKAFHNDNFEEIAAAAYTCSLFLSAILENYPTATLHTFVHYIQENHRRFSFNCNMYETIFSRIESETLKNVCLLGGDNRPKVRECSKEDIFEAFDFYTNR
jgi:hypothetical protein